jgi:hypothetical protein
MFVSAPFVTVVFDFLTLEDKHNTHTCRINCRSHSIVLLSKEQFVHIIKSSPLARKKNIILTSSSKHSYKTIRTMFVSAPFVTVVFDFLTLEDKHNTHTLFIR